MLVNTHQNKVDALTRRLHMLVMRVLLCSSKAICISPKPNSTVVDSLVLTTGLPPLPATEYFHNRYCVRRFSSEMVKFCLR